MRISRYNVFLFFAILFAITGGWFYYDWNIEKVEIHLCLLNFIPSIIFFMIYILEKKCGSKKKIQSISHLIILFTIVPCILFLYIVNSYIPFEYGIRNLRKYSSIIADNPTGLSVYHFPRKIPSNARNVKFFYRAGSIIRLSYCTTPEEINKLCDRFSKIKTRSLSDKSSKDYESMSFDWFPSELEKKRRGLPTNTNSYHGKRHGVSIDKRRNIIKYWAESW